MDGQYKKSKYEEIVEKLDQTRMEINEEMSWRNIKFRTDEILKDIRSNNDTADLNKIFLVLAISLGLIVLFYMLRCNLILGISFTLFLFVFLIYYRVKLRDAISDNSRYKSRLADTDNNEVEKVKQQIHYINSGLKIKKTRLELIRYFYMFFFPIFLFALTSLFRNDIQSMQIFWSLAFAFIIGTGFWSYYFKPEIEDLEELQEELEQENNKLLMVVD